MSDMDIEQYIKELSPCQMVIAITEPFRAERRVFFMRYRADQEHFAHSTKNGYVFTDWGRRKAEDVLQILRDDVSFFIDHFAQFRNLCVKYAAEYNQLDKLLEESQSRRRIAVHWHDQAVLFKQTRRLEKKETPSTAQCMNLNSSHRLDSCHIQRCWSLWKVYL